MGTWIVGAVVFLMIGLAGRKVYNDKKSGKGCGCGCDGCSEKAVAGQKGCPGAER